MWAVTVSVTKSKILNMRHETSEDHCGLEKPVQSWATKELLKVTLREKIKK